MLDEPACRGVHDRQGTLPAMEPFPVVLHHLSSMSIDEVSADEVATHLHEVL